VESGFRPAVNNIYWTGDAGMAASLDDMIAWERFIDATRDDPVGLYNCLSAPQSFRDGAPAGYGFGLAQVTMQRRKVTCHGGALRGWRSFRLHAAAERLSVVVLFNHMGNPGAAAAELFAAALGEPTAAPGMVPDAAWVGRYAEAETGLAIRVAITPGEGMRLHYATQSEALTADAKGNPVGDGVHLSRVEGAVWMERPVDNLTARLQPLAEGVSMDVAGVFRSEEFGAELACVLAGGVLYGAFSGDLGQGIMEPLIPFAKDVWLLPCPRALDHFAPGDWTLSFRRGADGQVDGLQLGCWLARDIAYTRIS
jgi:D-aminopeptidase